jgi:acid phosphatase (class A)
MIVKLVFAATAASAAAAVALAVAQPTAPTAYLPADTAPDTIAILPSAPTPDSPRGLTDRTVFKATRALKDTPRWALAVNDANQAPAAMMKDFSCSLGVGLTPANAPRFNALMTTVIRDVSRAVNRPKDLYQRQRPYLIDEGEICLPKTESLAKSPDYPSGHTTWGWTIGLLLAELAPDRATPILVRARAYGESRVVCGVHNASAIEAGRTDAAALVAALHGSPAFRADMAGASVEMAALRASGAPKPEQCEAEAALTAKTPW